MDKKDILPKDADGQDPPLRKGHVLVKRTSKSADSSPASEYKRVALNGRHSFDSQAGRIAYVVSVGMFKDIDIRANLKIRAGIVPYWKTSQGIMCGMGVDRRSGLLTDLAGRHEFDENLAGCVKRECKEESLELLQVQDEQLQKSIAVYSSVEVIVFYEYEITQAWLAAFIKKANETKAPEISAIKILSLEKLLEICANNKDSKGQNIMFRPVAMTLVRAQGLSEQLLK